MALMRSDLAVVRSTTSRPTGTIMAPPTPCRTRVAVSIGRPVAAAQATDARVKIATAVMKTRRAPNRGVNPPPAGISTAGGGTEAVPAALAATAGRPQLPALCGGAGGGPRPAGGTRKQGP